jgi:hypothetical protein
MGGTLSLWAPGQKHFTYGAQHRIWITAHPAQDVVEEFPFVWGVGEIVVIGPGKLCRAPTIARSRSDMLAPNNSRY